MTENDNYHCQKRGGQGSRNYDCSKGDLVAAVRSVSEERDDAIMISENGTVIRIHAADVATQSRYGSGVRVMRLDEGDRVVTVCCTERGDVEPKDLPDEKPDERPVVAPTEDEIEEMLSHSLTEEE